GRASWLAAPVIVMLCRMPGKKWSGACPRNRAGAAVAATDFRPAGHDRGGDVAVEGEGEGALDLDFPRAHGEPPGAALFRQVCADFQVDEDLGITPEGHGEHLYLRIRKTDQNTRWVAK